MKQKGPGWFNGLVVGLSNNSYKPITNMACTRLVAANDKAYKLHTHGRWFSPGTPASSTTKTGRHDTAEILLKMALNTINRSNINEANSSEYIVDSPTY